MIYDTQLTGLVQQTYSSGQSVAMKISVNNTKLVLKSKNVNYFFAKDASFTWRFYAS